MIQPSPTEHVGIKPPPATAADTRRVLIERSKRTFVPIPKPFVQRPPQPGRADRPGPLATFVTHGDVRGLLAFLLLHTVISSGARDDGWSTTLPLSVWARAFDTVRSAQQPAANSAASRILSRLEQRRLISRERTGRSHGVRVTLLAADGSGEPYTRPRGTTPSDRFLKLSHDFWFEELDKKLSLPGIAMLLVALHGRPTFTLATERVPEWYGWSADTAERGFAELRDHGILTVTKKWKSGPLAPDGLIAYNEYTVEAPFDLSTTRHRQEASPDDPSR